MASRDPHPPAPTPPVSAQELETLRTRVVELERAESERLAALEALHLQEEQERHFTQKLTILHEMGNALSKASTFDELTRQAVELAHFRLGFSRVGVWFVTGPDMVRGSFGISEKGDLRDERDTVRPLIAPAAVQAMANKDRLVVMHNSPLFDHTGAQVGTGTQAIAALWDGERAIGVVSADDLLALGTIDDRQAEILVLFASTLGHLCTRKRSEESRLALEARVQHAQRLESLGVLAGGIAHDFNNLLVGILGNAELTLSDIAADSPVRANLNDILTAAQRAAGLTREMLAYAGKGKLLVQPFLLHELIARNTGLLQMSISKKAAIEYALDSTSPSIEADPAQILQVVMNLVTNASEAIGDATGTIRLSTGAMYADVAYLQEGAVDTDLSAGQYVFLEVSDTGHGIDPSIRPQIFDPFFTTKFTGRGLGLAAVLGIVRGHKGTIRVYSESGRGARFRVLFPASVLPARPLATEPSAAPAARGEGTVLLVDDDPTVSIVGRRMLERMGYTVIAARDGREGVDTFRAHRENIRCVVLDLTMPVMSGEEAFRLLRELDPAIPVIIASGYGESDVASRFAGATISGFVQKPFSYATLAAALAVATGNGSP